MAWGMRTKSKSY